MVASRFPNIGRRKEDDITIEYVRQRQKSALDSAFEVDVIQRRLIDLLTTLSIP